MAQQSIEQTLFKLIMPTLILVIGFFIKSKLDSIDEGILSIKTVLVEQGKMNVRLDRAEEDIKGIRQKLGLTAMIGVGKPEDEITLSNLIK
jgi:hypothetical protein